MNIPEAITPWKDTVSDWTLIEDAYNDLLSQVYPQPEDAGHRQLTWMFINWLKPLVGESKSVIDFGCGEAFIQEMLAGMMGVENYVGIALGKDVKVATSKGRNVIEADFNFLPSEFGLWDLGMSRHSLEHSPFPVITLKLWKRYVREYLAVVLPHPDWYKFGGRNHPSVMTHGQARAAFEMAGWDVVAESMLTKNGSPDVANYPGYTAYELWYLLRHKELGA